MSVTAESTIETRPASGTVRVEPDHSRPRVEPLEVPLEDYLTVPKERYTSAEFAAREDEKLWKKVWQIACREEQIPKVGDYIEYRIVNTSILVVRSAPDTIKAYFNTCLHRGALLKEGCGNAREIMCRWHGWRWNLDGSNKAVVDPHLFQAGQIDPDTLHLPECQVGVWAGGVYINMDPDAEPLREFLGALPERAAIYEMDKMRLARWRTTIVDANWKTCLDAFNEAYHAQANHPQIGIYMDDTSYRYEQHERHNMNTPPANAFGRPTPRMGDYVPDVAEVVAAAMDDFAGLDLLDGDPVDLTRQTLEALESMPDGTTLHEFFTAGRRHEAAQKGLNVDHVSDDDLLVGEDWHVFPNYIGPLNYLNAFMFRFRPNGTDPNSCLFDVWSLERPAADAPPKKVVQEFFPDWREHDKWGRVMEQDLEMMGRFRMGLGSPAFTHFRYGKDEANIVNFHRVLMEYLER